MHTIGDANCIQVENAIRIRRNTSDIFVQTSKYVLLGLNHLKICRVELHVSFYYLLHQRSALSCFQYVRMCACMLQLFRSLSLCLPETELIADQAVNFAFVGSLL